MRANRNEQGTRAAVNGRSAPVAESGRRAGAWRQRRETTDGRDWLCLDLATPEAARGEARAPYSDALRDALDEIVRAGESDDDPVVPPHLDSARERRLARGLVATARLDLLARQHGVPLHLWLGGAVRSDVRVTLPVAFRTQDRAGRVAELRREHARLHDARALGITSFALHDTTTDVDLIAHSVAAMRDALGSDANIVLRLAGQLDAAPARELASQVRGCELVAIVDPCPSVATGVDATRDDLPALGLSASRYARAALLQCLATAPPVVLLIDPLLEGGPIAVRELASVARVLQTDVALTAEDGGAWLFHLCTELATVVPACLQPIEAPLSWTLDGLQALGVREGAVSSSARP